MRTTHLMEVNVKSKHLSLLLAILLLCGTALPALAQQKPNKLPALFSVKVQQEERMMGKNEQLIYKEYLVTKHAGVNKEIRALVDQLDAQYSPLVPPDQSKNARRNNRLDVEITYRASGQSWMSMLITARIMAKRSQLQSPFATRTYDLKTGQRILLTDLFAQDSAGWALLQERVKAHLETVFPGENRDAQRIEQLTSLEALKEAEFTLGGLELTLHYEAKALFPDKVGLIHVRFFYPELEKLLTPEAAKQMDNRGYKMVALSFDDGPRHNNSTKALNALRRGGGRGAFFVVGKVFLEGLDIVHRQFDQNHTVASHSYNHWSGYSMKADSRLKEVAAVDALFSEHLGEKSRFFRAPGGTYPPWAEADIGLPIIQWSVDTYDYRGLKPVNILYNVRKNVQDGDIILMHDTGNELHKALPDMCKYLTENGYLMVSLEELALAQGVQMEPNIVYHRFLNGGFSERRDSNTN